MKTRLQTELVLPYVHPHIAPLRRTKDLPRWLFFCCYYVSGVLAGPVVILITLLYFVGFPINGRGCGFFQSLIFRLENWLNEHGGTIAPVMFPGDKTPIAIDIGIVDAVIKLWNLGTPTKYCCEGHMKLTPGDVRRGIGSTAYIALEEGQRFPQDMLERLDVEGISYHIEVSRQDEGLRETIYAGSNEPTLETFDNNNKQFCQAMQKWSKNA